jgi:hypothetical protein
MPITICPIGRLQVNGQSMIEPAASDDTVELQLTPEQMRALSQAAESAEQFVPDSAPQPLFEVSPAARVRRWHQTPVAIAKVAGIVIAYAAFAWWSAAQFAAQPKPPVMAVARPSVVVPAPASVAPSSQPTVKVINPFDKSEVFEFPAGSTYAENRDKVAQMLLERARERQGQWARVKPAVNLRTASLYSQSPAPSE